MIYLYNTLSRKKEEFKPITKNKVSFYYCGPTVYWTQHIGNLRGSFCADLVRRVFEYNDYDVKMVRNYTDVGHLTSDQDDGEDKLEKGAKREGVSPLKIAEKYIKIYEKDTSDLNILEPTFKPKATEHIAEMQEMIKILLDKGFAYKTPKAIYFDITKAKDYTRLSGQKLEENIVGAGKGSEVDLDKKNSQDFVLWFFKTGVHKNALQYWESLFKSDLVDNGEGFPGWHMECSAMSKKYLGDTLDIHMGGIEHIPVHHTNEIAQSECANNAPYVNYWLHNEHLNVDGGKMSKSEGTSYSLLQIKEKGFDPLVLRYFFLQAHYRSKQNFTWEALDSAQNGLERLYLRINKLGKTVGNVSRKYKDKFLKKINDDINSPEALAVLQELLKSDLADDDKLATILDFDNVFGLNFFEEINKEEEKKFIGTGGLENVSAKFDISTSSEDVEKIKKLARERKLAKAIKNWEESDRLRDEINKLGYEVKDTDKGMELIKK